MIVQKQNSAYEKKTFFDTLNINDNLFLEQYIKKYKDIKKYKNLSEILYSFPNRYKMIRYSENFFDIPIGVFFCCKFYIKTVNICKNKIIKAVLVDSVKNEIECLWYNLPFLKYILKVNNVIFLQTKKYREYSIFQPTIVLEKNVILRENIVPIYSDIIVSKHIKNILYFAANSICDLQITAQRVQAFFKIHLPKTEQDILSAQDFFRKERGLLYAASFFIENKKQSFQLTSDINSIKQIFLKNEIILYEQQKKALEDIMKMFLLGETKNIWLYGDVGSGKTFVAFGVALLFLKNQYRVVFCVPTKALLEQTYFVAKNFFQHYTVGLLNKQKSNYDVIIGTQNLFNSNVHLDNVGLVILDEEQKFGVKQKNILVNNTKLKNSLLLSATPSPRTFSLAHNKLIDSYFMLSNKRHIHYETLFYEDMLWTKKIHSLSEYEKILCVFPQIKSGNINLLHGKKQLVFYDINTIHGNMTDIERNFELQSFSNKKRGILLATNILEVGVNIPNLNTMFIFDANKFGASQLHQLKGRIGRQTKSGTCYLIFKKTISDTRLMEIKNIMSFNDGYEVSQYDSQNRGEGQIYSTKQSGFFNDFILRQTDIQYVKENLEIYDLFNSIYYDDK